MRKLFLIILLIFSLISCEKQGVKPVDVSHIDLELTVNRFDRDFYTSKPADLIVLKQKYPAFFPKNTPDSIWLQKLNDPDELALFAAVQKTYADFSGVSQALRSLFQHIKYYYPNFTVPEVTTVLSDIDYDYRVLYNSRDLIISLDVYLGKNSPFYADYPAYIKENNTAAYIPVDVAMRIVETILPPNKDRSFLGKMIYEGKKMYLLDRFLPEVSDKLKIGYTQEKLTWAQTNQEQVWRYFIEKNLLYETDPTLDKRFMDVAPFSKFFLALDNESPGRIGVWTGWQIVRSFMRRNDVSLPTLIQMETQTLFAQSKYKPRN